MRLGGSQLFDAAGGAASDEKGDQGCGGQGRSLAGLVPGNPKMATAGPTAERLLDVFTSLHLLIHQVGEERGGQVLEVLSPL